MKNTITNKMKKLLHKCIHNPRDIDKFLFCHLFGFSYKEFKYYHFEDCFLKRFSFVSTEHSKKIINKYNKNLTNKKENYILLKDYYKRDCCLIEPDNSETENVRLILDFVKRHKTFIIKEFNGSGGKGIKKYCFEDNNEWVIELLKQYPNGCLLEEIIKQSGDVEVIHPWSINTLRITTINYGDKVETIYPVFRLGVKHNLVDNSSEGLLCAIDVETCNIFSARNTKGEDFIYHPDTNEKIIGFHIPELESAIVKAKQLALIYKDNVFVGFDFAHTDNGWELIEANTDTRFTIWQLPYQKGFRKELKSIEKAINDSSKKR